MKEKKNYDEKEEICFLDLQQDCQKNPHSQIIPTSSTSIRKIAQNFVITSPRFFGLYK